MAETAHNWLKPILKIIRLILATILSIGIWYLFFQLDMFESMREIDDRIGLLLIIISVLGFFLLPVLWWMCLSEIDFAYTLYIAFAGLFILGGLLSFFVIPLSIAAFG